MGIWVFVYLNKATVKHIFDIHDLATLRQMIVIELLKEIDDLDCIEQ